MEQVNVEQIMQEIRKNIEESGADLDIMPFEEVPFPEDLKDRSENKDNLSINQIITRLQSESQIQFYYDMPKSVKSLIKKVIRKSVHFVFFPIMESQNRFNADVVQSIRLLGDTEEKNYKQLMRKVKKLESENRKLKRIIDRIKENKDN